LVGFLSKYFIYKVNNIRAVGPIIENKKIELKTRKNVEQVDERDKFLLYIKNKGVLITGFNIKNVDKNKKPYTAEIDPFPSFYSKFKPQDLQLEDVRRLVEIGEIKYSELKRSMENNDNKISDYLDLKGPAQLKGERFENETYEFFKKIFASFPNSEVKKGFEYETQKGENHWKLDVFIKVGEYEIICEAFTNENELNSKNNWIGKIDKGLEQSKRDKVRFILFYEDLEEKLPNIGNKIEKNTIILGSRAKMYYEWLLNTTSDLESGEFSNIAAYHLLGELNIEERDKEILATPYLKLEEGDKNIYIFKKDVNEIIPVLYVARRERGSKKFYQRLLKRDKLGSISDYLSDTNDNGERKHTTFLNSIIISLEKIEENDDKIYIPFKYGSVAILDGQHRVYGAYLSELKSKKSNELYFTAVVNENNQAIDLSEQQEYFLTINTTQTKVDPEQIWRSYSELVAYRNTVEGIISQVAKDIEKIGLLKIKKSIGSSKGISFAGLCVNIKKYATSLNLIIKSDKIDNDHQVNEKVRLIVKQLELLLEATKEDLGQSNIFLEHDGRLSVLFKLYSKIIKAISDVKKDIKKYDIKQYVKALNEILKENPNIFNEIITSGEGPRKRSAEMLTGLINEKDVTPKLSYTPTNESFATERSIVLSISSKLAALSNTPIKDAGGKNVNVLKSTGNWIKEWTNLTLPMESKEEFAQNFIGSLFKILHEGGKNIPEEFKKEQVLRDIIALRNYLGHDIEHGEDPAVKREKAEEAIEHYLGYKKLPEDLNLSELKNLRKEILTKVEDFLNRLYESTREDRKKTR